MKFSLRNLALATTIMMAGAAMAQDAPFTVTENWWHDYSGNTNSNHRFGTGVNGKVYANNVATGELTIFDAEGNVTKVAAGTLAHGITHDDAGNILMHRNWPDAPTSLGIYKAETGEIVDITISYPNASRLDVFGRIIGDIFSEEGAVLYIGSGSNIVTVCFKEGAQCSNEDVIGTEYETAEAPYAFDSTTVCQPLYTFEETIEMGDDALNACAVRKRGELVPSWFIDGEWTKIHTVAGAKSSEGFDVFRLDDVDYMVVPVGDVNYTTRFAIAKAEDGSIVWQSPEDRELSVAAGQGFGSIVANKVDDNTVEIYIFGQTHANPGKTYAGMYTVSNGGGETPEPVVYTVSFDNEFSNWDKVYAYVWNGDKNNTWPGQEMTLEETMPGGRVEGGIFTTTFTDLDFEPTHIIFNNNAGEQTADLEFENYGIYSMPNPALKDALFLVGEFNGWAPGDPVYQMTKEDNVYSIIVASLEGEFKVSGPTWDVSYGGSSSSENWVKDENNNEVVNVKVGVAEDAWQGSSVNFKAEKMEYAKITLTVAEEGPSSLVVEPMPIDIDEYIGTFAAVQFSGAEYDSESEDYEFFNIDGVKVEITKGEEPNSIIVDGFDGYDGKVKGIAKMTDEGVVFEFPAQDYVNGEGTTYHFCNTWGLFPEDEDEESTLDMPVVAHVMDGVIYFNDWAIVYTYPAPEAGDDDVDPGMGVPQMIMLCGLVNEWLAPYVPATAMTADVEELALEIGETARIEAEITPENASFVTFYWTSSDEEVATVEDGVVTAVAPGKATITVANADKVAATVNVTVTKPVDPNAATRGALAYALNAEKNDNGYKITFKASDNAIAKLVLTNKADAADSKTIEIGQVHTGDCSYDLAATDIDADKTYNWAIELYSTPVDGDNIALVYEHPDAQPSAVRGGVVTFTDPFHESYGMTMVAHGKGQGFDLYDQEGKHVEKYHANSGIFTASNQSSPFRGWERNGKAVFVDWSDGSAGYWVMDPLHPETAPYNLLIGEKASSGLYTYEGVQTAGGASCVAFYGEGENEVMYAFEEDAHENKVARYPIAGAEFLTVAADWVSTRLTAGLLANTNVEIVPTEYGLFVSQCRAVGSNIAGCPGLVFADLEDNILWNSATEVNDDNEQIFSSSSAGFAISCDGSLYAHAGYNCLHVGTIEWEEGVPTLNELYVLPFASITNFTQIKFDAANNIHMYDRDHKGYKVYALPGENCASTPGKGVIGVADGIENIKANDAANAVYYNVNGVRVAADNLTPGVYVKVAGDKAVKVIVK